VRGRTVAVGGAVGTEEGAVGGVVGSVATCIVGAPLGSTLLAPPASEPGRGSSGTGGGFDVCCPAHEARSAGEIMAALITTERTTSLIGDRPS
jgi:hypothetical protein